MPFFAPAAQCDHNVRDGLARTARIVRQLGIRCGLRYLLLERSTRAWDRLLRREPSSNRYRLHPSGAELPLWCRANTSDRQVFSQVFVEREYACLDYVVRPQLIIDCGANVGYTSAFFLSRYPSAHVIAVEPDPGNFAVLESNLGGYGKRAIAMRTAVWSGPVALKLSRDSADDRDWAVQVRLPRDDEVPDLIATDIGQLLESSGFDRIDILKIDVEHAEIEIFGRGFESWLDRVDNIAIELHGKDARDTFFRALNPAEFSFSEFGELTIARRSA